MSKTQTKKLIQRALSDAWIAGQVSKSDVKKERTINYICQKLIKNLEVPN